VSAPVGSMIYPLLAKALPTDGNLMVMDIGARILYGPQRERGGKFKNFWLEFEAGEFMIKNIS